MSWFKKLLRGLSGKGDRPPPPPKRYPLAEEQKAELAKTLDALQTEGVLHPGEVALDDAIDVAEREDIPGGDFYDAAHVLAFMEPFANLAFFADQVEVVPQDFVSMVGEVARLAGRDDLVDIEVRGADGEFIDFARRGEFGPDNAVVTFSLGGGRHEIPFLAFSKNLPIGLLERLADIVIAAEDPRRFYAAHNDQYEILTRLTESQAQRLNAALADDRDWFLKLVERDAAGAADA
jgi:hypothetical protein